MVAVHQDIVVERGGTFELAVLVLDSDGVDPRTDLAGWTGAMQIRAERDPTSTLLATATVAIDTATAVVTATIADDLTEVMAWRSGEYDLKITNGTQTLWLAKGTARFEQRSTT